MTYEVVDASPVEASSKPTPASVSLPSIREAGTWSRATDRLLEALEQEEREALAAFEAARERARKARQAASAMRQLRQMVTVGEAPPAKRLPPTAAAPIDPPAPAATSRWARDYACCRECGRTEIKHAARGLCFSCYSRASKSAQGQTA